MMEEIRPEPPQTNRGGTRIVHGAGITIAIDWFTCTYLSEQIPEKAMRQLFIRWTARYVKNKARYDEPLNTRNGFLHRIVCKMGDEAASFSWGGNNGYACIDLRGGICSFMAAEDWKLFLWFVKRYQARITRCDIAVDTFEGELTIDRLIKAWKQNPRDVWHIKGRVPVFREQGCYELGRTRYIGGQLAPRIMCVYEKGPQLAGRRMTEKNECELPDPMQGDRRWVRSEYRQYRRDGYEIPYDVLIPENWWGYIAGCGPLFAKLVPSGDQKRGSYRRKSRYAEIAIAFRRTLEQVHFCYGTFIEFMCNAIGDPVIILELLRNAGRMDEDGNWVAKEWKYLAKFPDWAQDHELLDLINATVREFQAVKDVIANPVYNTKYQPQALPADTPDF